MASGSLNPRETLQSRPPGSYTGPVDEYSIGPFRQPHFCRTWVEQAVHAQIVETDGGRGYALRCLDLL